MNLIQKLMILMAVIGLASLGLNIFRSQFEWIDLLDLTKDLILYWLIYRLAGKVED